MVHLIHSFGEIVALDAAGRQRGLCDRLSRRADDLVNLFGDLFGDAPAGILDVVFPAALLIGRRLRVARAVRAILLGHPVRAGRLCRAP